MPRPTSGIAGRALLALIVQLVAGCADFALPDSAAQGADATGGQSQLHTRSVGRDDRRQR